jgi:hypothetical protein
VLGKYRVASQLVAARVALSSIELVLVLDNRMLQNSEICRSGSGCREEVLAVYIALVHLQAVPSRNEVLGLHSGILGFKSQPKHMLF